MHACGCLTLLLNRHSIIVMHACVVQHYFLRDSIIVMHACVVLSIYYNTVYIA